MVKELLNAFLTLKKQYIYPQKQKLFKHFGEDASISLPCLIEGQNNVTLCDNVYIGPYSVLYAPVKTITIKSNSYSGPRLYIGTGDHLVKVGYHSRTINQQLKNKLIGEALDWDVVIDEDVWMGENVSILCKHIGRGSVIAAGAIVTKDVLPYSIMGGVPARLLKIVFTKDEILEHERQIYEPSNRLSEKEIDEIFKQLE